jgi:hypothetical protein
MERVRARSKEIASRPNKLKNISLTDGTVARRFSAAGSKSPPAVAPSKPLVAELRAKLSASKDPKERARLARQIREARGTMFEMAATLPDLESVRKRIEQTTDPREKAILARYARGLRKSTIQIKAK